jgi:hypothetical protein
MIQPKKGTLSCAATATTTKKKTGQKTTKNGQHFKFLDSRNKSKYISFKNGFRNLGHSTAPRVTLMSLYCWLKKKKTFSS